MTIYAGTSGGNKIVTDPVVGTLTGNLDVQEIWVGTPLGNRLVFQRVQKVILAATPSSATQINLSWTDFGADSYRLFRDGNSIYSGTSLFKIDIGLMANNLYTYRIDAIKGGSVVSSDTVTVKTKLVPIVLAATVNSATQVTLTWSNIGADLYKVYKGATQIYSSTGLTKIDVGLSANTTYNYRVDAIVDDLVSVSDTRAVITDYAPITLSATAISSSQVDLSWTDVGAEAYSVYRVPTLIYGPGTALTKQDTGLTGNSIYNYRVDALRGGVANVSGTATATTQPSPITLTATPIAHNQIELSWTDVGAGTTYEVYRGTTKIYGPGTLLSTIDGGVGGNATYHYRVDAISDGTVIASDTETATTPFQPITLNATVNSQVQVTLTWNSIGADSYQVFRGSTSIYGPGPLLTKVDTGLTANTPYIYRVDAIFNGSVVKSDTESVRTSLNPITLTATPASSTQINLSWTNVGAASYTLLRGTTVISGPDLALSKQDTGRTANTTYAYTIRATSADGTITSDTESAMTKLGPITITAVATSSTAIKVTWSDNDADSYVVKKGTTSFYSGGLFTKTDTGLTPDKSYTYTVDAIKGGVSHASASATGKTQAITYSTVTWTKNAVSSASYNESGVNRGVSECYYGRYSSNHGNQKSQARWDIPAEIRNCYSIDKVEISWYNLHTFLNSGGKVCMVGHHNTSLSGNYGGSTGFLLLNGTVVNWPAGKPGYINGTTWFDVTNLTSSGRYSVKEEIRVHGMQGFGLVADTTSQNDYGYAQGATQGSIQLRITYRIRNN